jgi:2-polyprenyl-3-methyl-5-hydroxy-6-metoxy-1,4-benzoquinol methylase
MREQEIKNCCICGAEAHTVYNIPFLEVYGMAQDYTQRIKICPHCGFIYVANPFQGELLSNRYKKMSKYEFDKNKIITEEKDGYIRRCKRQYDFIKNNDIKYKSILEVGAASGFNLSLYKKDGITVYGIEPSVKNVESCKEKYGIELFHGMFQEYREGQYDKTYDLVFLSHVLEHIVNPYQFISELSKINNHYIFIDVPTLDYKFKDEPFGMFTDEHVNYFTFEGLNSLMTSLHYSNIDVNIAFDSSADVPSGCPCLLTLWQKQDIVNIITTPPPPPLTVNKLPVMSSSHVLGEYLRTSEELQKEINIIIDKIQAHKLAVWGTGNTSSRLIANSGLRYKNIVKFYDSDIRKKDTLFLGKKIIPFNPDDIDRGEVDTILIASYVFQKEIYSIIKKSGIACEVIELF